MFVFRSKRTHWTVHFHKPRWLGPTVSGSPSTLCIGRMGGHNSRGTKVLKTHRKLKKKNKNTQEKATFRDSQSCSTQAKITNACFCNCLDPSSDPIAEDLPASCTYWRTLMVKWVSHAAPALRGSPLDSSLLHDSIYSHHKHVDIYLYVCVCVFVYTHTHTRIYIYTFIYV